MLFRFVVGAILAMCAYGMWGSPLYAQDNHAPAGVAQATQTVPISLSLRLTDDIDISEPITVSFGVNLAHEQLISVSDASSLTVRLHITPMILAVSSGVSVTIDSFQTVGIVLDLAELDDTATITGVSTFVGTVNQNANLRLGPGTNYAVGGQAALGDSVRIVGRNDTNEWYQLETGVWIAAFLVDGLPEDLSSLEDVAEKPQEAGSTPTGWMRHFMKSRRVSFAVPPGWNVDEETADTIHLLSVDGPVASISGMFIDGAMPADSDDEMIQRLKQVVLRLLGNGEVTFVENGVVDVSDRRIFVTGNVIPQDVNGAAVFAATLFANGAHSVLLLHLTFDEQVTGDAALDTILQLANSFVSEEISEQIPPVPDDIDVHISSTGEIEPSPGDNVVNESRAETLNSFMVGDAMPVLPAPTGEDFDVIPIGRGENIVYLFVRNNTIDTFERIDVNVVVRTADGAMLAVNDAIALQPRRVAPGEITFDYIYFSDISLPADARFDFDVTASILPAGRESGDLVIVEHTRIDDRFVGVLRNSGTKVVGGSIKVQVLCFDQKDGFIESYGDYTSQDRVEPNDSIPFQVDLGGPCSKYLIFASGFSM